MLNRILNMRIKTKILSTFGIILIGLLIIFYIDSGTIANANDHLEGLYTDELVPIIDLSKIIEKAMVNRANLRNMLLTNSKEKYDVLKKEIQDNLNDCETLIKKVEQTDLSPDEKNLIPIFKENWKSYSETLPEIYKLIEDGKKNQAYENINTVPVGFFNKAKDAVDKLIISKDKLSHTLWQDFKSESASSKKMVLALGFLIGVLVMGLGIGLSSIIAKPLSEIASVAGKIAAGDSDVSIKNLERTDEIGALSAALIQMTGYLKEKAFWYQQILDAVPFPLSVTDKNMNWTFTNKAAIKSVGAGSEQLVGKKCDKWNTPICKTQNCGIEALKKNIPNSYYELNDKYYQVNTSYVYNQQGEVTGHVEVMNNVTDSKKMEKYLSESTLKILKEMDKFAQGDLTVELQIEKDDDIGRLFAGFNKSVKNIRALIYRLSEAVEAASSASIQITSSSEEMAAGAHEQSLQTSEVAGAVEEMTRTILQTSQNTNTAAMVAKTSGDNALEGGKVVAETIEGMNKIADVVHTGAEMVFALGNSSEKIGEIVQVIDDIADQTNLLALNAAIEAARAGEQGRGFAVVADEVRKLAERTTRATKEIAEMIKLIQKETSQAVSSMRIGTTEVETGRNAAIKAGKVLEVIVEGSKKVTDIIAQVAAAGEEQSVTSEEIAKNVDAISSVSHETTIGIQQIAKAAEDLNRLTDNLLSMTKQFRIS